MALLTQAKLAGDPDILHCTALARQHDYERYLASAMAPSPDVCAAWHVIFAWNYELASIADKVSEPMVGFIRFAWWKEALMEIYSGGVVRRHPVVMALKKVVDEYHLPQSACEEIMAARQSYFAEQSTWRDQEEMIAYARATSSRLLQLCMHCVEQKPEPTRAQATETLGILWMLTAMLRSTASQSSPDGLRGELLAWCAQHRATLEWGVVPACLHGFVLICDFYLQRLRQKKNCNHPWVRMVLAAKLLWFALITHY